MLNIQRTSSANIDRHIKALICGNPGSGKTLIASTFPDPFYLTTEGLLMSIADRDIPYHKLGTIDELLTTIRMLEQPPRVRSQQFGFPVNTIVVDTIDDVSRMVMRERLRNEHRDQAQIADYGWLKGQMNGIVTALRNLDINVVMTCHLKSKEVGGVTQFLPDIEGGFAEQLAGYVDLAVVLRSSLTSKVVGQNTVRDIHRFMQTIPDPTIDFIKDHSGKLPHEFPINFEDDYERLATIIYGKPQALPDLAVAEPATEVRTAPVVEPEPPAEGTLEAAAAEAEQEVSTPEGRFTCVDCDTRFDDEDQRDAAHIKYRKELCGTCFIARAA